MKWKATDVKRSSFYWKHSKNQTTDCFSNEWINDKQFEVYFHGKERVAQMSLHNKF